MSNVVLIRPPRIDWQDADAKLGIAWWHVLDPAERAEWLRRANSAVPADAWEAFKSSGPLTD